MKEKGKKGCSEGCRTSVLAAAGVLLLVFAAFALVPATAQAAVEVRVDAPEYVDVEETSFVATIVVDDVTNLNSAQFDLSFDKSVVEVSDVKDGEIGGEEMPIVGWRLNPDKDTVRVIVMPSIGEGVSGVGYLAKIEFEVKGDEGDESVLDIGDVILTHPFNDKKIEGKKLFLIDKKFKDELDDEEISDELKEKFEDEGYHLENPTVTIESTTKWVISDVQEDGREIYVVDGGVREEPNLPDLIVSDGREIPVKWIDATVTIGQPPSEDGGKEDDDPEITAFEPAEAVVSSAEGESMTFKVTLDQPVEISWQLNGTEVQRDEEVTEAAYTNTSVAVGTWNLTAIATNTETELSTAHTWIWNVASTSTLEPGAATPTPTPKGEETEGTTPTPTPTLAPGETPLPEEEATPTKPTPTQPSTEEEKTTKTKARPTPTLEPEEKGLPGFEAVFAIAAVVLGVAVAEVLQRRAKK